ncbi:MAG: hypothetical protein LBI54_03075 [Lachnospiraceae bacterium]|jgi:hypothetical protein|nr:hypothetical protein [Lachnospiraceae bacterium]
MISEISAEDFARGMKNTYFEKLMTKTEIALRKEDYTIFCEVGETNGVPAEMIMRNCLADWAQKFREHD